MCIRDAILEVDGPWGRFYTGCCILEPGLITPLDIVEAIDGREPAFLCREIRRRGPGKATDPCVYKADCFIKTRMLAAEEAWRSALRSQTLAELVADGERLIDPLNKRAVAYFIEAEQR